MDADRQKIIDKIRKLLALSKSDNYHEAANAAGRAQALMEKYSIETAMLEEERAEKPADPIRGIIFQGKGGKLRTWVLNIAREVARANRLSIWYTSTNKMAVINAAGTPHNIEAAQVLLGWLIGEVDRLYKEERPAGFTRGVGRSWANAFRLGAAKTIGQRLAESIKETRERMRAGVGFNGEEYQRALENNDIEAMMRLDAQQPKYLPARVETALLRLDEEAKRAETWKRQNVKGLRTVMRPSWVRSQDAYKRGQEAGKRASIKGPAGLIG